MKNNEAKLIAANSVQLDPTSCGSMIGYTIVLNGESLVGEVTLTDCNHMINWSFGDYEGGVEKVDAAISILSEFRKHYVKAEAEAEALKKKKKKKKKLEEKK